MDDWIIALFCLCDDLLKAMDRHTDPQCRMSDAEVMLVALVAVRYFSGNLRNAQDGLAAPQYIPQMLSESQFNRRLHRIRHLFLILFALLAEVWKELNVDAVFSIDTFPIAVCDNIRIRRARLYQDEAYRGYIASKKRYFYGLKLHLMVTRDGKPVEFFLTPGAFSDVKGLELFDFDLPSESIVYADRAYTHHHIEDVLHEATGIALKPMRKKNTKRPFAPWVRYLQHYHRKRVETSGSVIEQMLPKTIHAVTPAGFELKVVLFVLAFSLRFL